MTSKIKCKEVPSFKTFFEELNVKSLLALDVIFSFGVIQISFMITYLSGFLSRREREGISSISFTSSFSNKGRSKKRVKKS